MSAPDERIEPAALDLTLVGAMFRTARILAALVMVAALLVLAGWVLNVEVLRSVIPGLTAMNPGGTAMALLFAGASLWCLTQKKRSGHGLQTAKLMAIAVVAMAALRLVLYAIGWEWGPDQWLFRAKLDLYEPPNRMAPNTAFGLLLVGLGLLSIDLESRRGVRPAQWLALAAGLLSLLALVGYAFHAAELIGIHAFIPMALNSAVSLGLLSIGVMFARPDRGIMSVIADREIGGVMARRLIPASIIAPAAIALLASAAQQAEWFDSSFGIPMVVVATTILFATLSWWSASSLNRFDTQRLTAQKELDRQNTIFQSILKSMGDGVVVADREGRFLQFNPVAERILGLGATDAPPSEWTNRYGLFSPETGEPLKLDEIPLVKAIHGESTTQQEILIRNPNLPEDVMISVTGRPLIEHEGVEGGVVVFQDITQRQRAAEAIRKARDASEAANRAKSEFLANMSHEIRTPMNAVIGMTELVLDGDLNEMQRMYLKIVKDSAESLLSLINDILDFSKIEADKLELDRTSFPLRDLLGDAMKTLSVRARGKDLELACHVATNVPEHLIGDPHRLRQVVTNLVGNALKFTERGEVVLDVSADHVDDDQVAIHFSVRDTGIGIPTDKLHLLFNAFSQVDASTTRRYGGTGLGLAITARLVPMMHGRTWVESEPGQGSTFHFTARFERDKSPPAPPATPDALKNLRLLVVDDNATNRLILNELLTSWGMRPTCLASAEMALNELRHAHDANDPFRVVLSDVHMPGIDGFELTSRIRDDGQFDSTVIMMLSSGAGPGDVSRCRELGATSHLIKPVKSSELYSAIAAVMGNVDRVPSAPELSTQSGRSLNILLAEDSEANQQLALGVLHKWGHLLTIANNGQEAVDAFARGKYDVILMDVQMPLMDGVQATARIREIEQQQSRGHIPIVAMTAHAMKGDREEFMRAGMDDYVTKPIRWAELRRVLDGAVRKSSDIAAASVETKETQDAETQSPHQIDADQMCSTTDSPNYSNNSIVSLDWDEAFRAVDGNKALLIQVMEELVNEWPIRLDELDRAAAGNDAPTARRAAHTIRGCLRFFGETEAVGTAEKIENLARTGSASDVCDFLPNFREQIDQILDEVKRWLAAQGKLWG